MNPEHDGADSSNTEPEKLDSPLQKSTVWAGLLGALSGAAVVGWSGLLLHT